MNSNKLRKYREPLDSFFEDLGEGFNEVGTELNKVFSNFPNVFEYPYYRTVKTVGQVNLGSDDKEYKVEVSAPGFTKDDLKIELSNSILNIKGEHTDEKKDYSRKEFVKSSFDRSFRVPENITGEIDAKFENGILTIGIKKKELPPKVEPKKIEIK